MNIKDNQDTVRKLQMLSSEKVNIFPSLQGEDDEIKIAYAQAGYSEISDFLTFDKTDREILFPSANALGCSFDEDLAKEVGKAVGEDLRDSGVTLAVISGPHPKRNPEICKNAYYYSEDALHASRMCEGFATGLRYRGVSTILDFFGFDDSVSPQHKNYIADKRLVNEIYEREINTFIRKIRPAGIFVPYGKINGKDPHDKDFLTEFRKKSGFGGMFISPHMGNTDSVSAVKNGVYPEFTNNPERTKEELLSAVESGEISQDDIEGLTARVFAVIKSVKSLAKTEYLHDKEVNYTMAKNAARECFVLLKNNGILPLEKKTALNIAGKNAVEPFDQIMGRYFVNAKKHPFTEKIKKFSDSEYIGDYDDTDFYSEEIRSSDKPFILFMGTSRDDNNEFTKAVSVPENQRAVLKALKEMGKKVIVVVTSAVIPAIGFSEYADAIIYDPITGEGSSEALAEILYGIVSPSGRLNQSVPYEAEDYPSYKYKDGENIRYSESVLMGYRFFTTDGKKAAYPFGHGLGYSEFEYSSPYCSYLRNDGTIDVSFDVTNTGKMPSKEVVQVYVRDIDKRTFRPGRELRFFEKVYLESGEMRRIKVRLYLKDFMFYDPDKEDFNIYSGRYSIDIARSSEDVKIAIPITILSDEKYTQNYSQKQLPSFYPENSRRILIANNEYKIVNKDAVSLEIKEGSSVTVSQMAQNNEFDGLLKSLYVKLRFMDPPKAKVPVTLDEQSGLKMKLIGEMSIENFRRRYLHLLDRPKKMSDVLRKFFGE